MKKNLVLMMMLVGTAVFAGPKITVYGGGSYSIPTSTGFANPPTQGRIGYPVGGLAVQFPVGKRFSIAIDASYFTRAFNTAAFGDVAQSAIQGDLTFNVWLGRFVSIGVGGYGGYILDPMRRSVGGTVSLSAFGMRNMDYGLTGSLNFYIPVSAKLAFTTGAKYHYGLANLANTGRLQFSDIIFFIGLTFGDMKKK